MCFVKGNIQKLGKYLTVIGLQSTLHVKTIHYLCIYFLDTLKTKKKETDWSFGKFICTYYEWKEKI